MFGFGLSGLGISFDLVTTVEVASAIGVVLYAVYLGSSMGIFKKSR